MIHPVQRVTVNHIFSIVCDYNFESRSIRLLIRENVLEDPIEAVCFGRRPIVGTNSTNVPDRIALRGYGFRVTWLSFVRVCADENLII